MKSMIKCQQGFFIIQKIYYKLESDSDQELFE